MKKTVKDLSNPENKLPPVPPLDLILYHWSPSKNRKQIIKYGLRTHRPTLQGEWKPPYICFSDDPWLAWILSGHMWTSIKSWDLWMCLYNLQDSFDHYEIILDTFPDTGRHYVKEYRVYTRVYKRDLIYLATRTQ